MMHIFCEVENKHFIKNRYLHCNIMNIQVCISQSGYVVCTFPAMIKKKDLHHLKDYDSSTQHELLSMEDYVFVTSSKAFAEYITGN